MNLDWPTQSEEGYFAGVIGDGRCPCLLAECGEEMADCLVGRMREGSDLRPIRVAQLEDATLIMYVLEALRSRGVGERLVRESLAWA